MKILLTPKAIEAKREYFRRWRAKQNPEAKQKAENDQWERWYDRNMAATENEEPSQCCLYCGDPILSKRPHAKYCSPTCKTKYSRMINKT